MKRSGLNFRCDPPLAPINAMCRLTSELDISNIEHSRFAASNFASQIVGDSVQRVLTFPKEKTVLSIQSVDQEKREAQRPIDRESVKTLAISVGVREAARQMNIPEGTVQAWSARGKWFCQPDRPKTVLQRQGATNATIQPSVALQNHLEQQKHKSRSLLAKYTVNASEVAARSRNPLEIAPLVDKVANVHAKVWPEQREQVQSDLHIQVLANQAQFFNQPKAQP